MQNRKNTIVIITKNFFFEIKGGSEIQAYYYAEELQKRNWSVYYIYETFGKQEEYVNFKKIQLIKIPRTKIIPALTNIFKFYSTLTKIKPDIIYIRDYHYLSISGFLPSSLRNRIIWASTSDDHVNPGMRRAARKFKEKKFLHKLIYIVQEKLFLFSIRRIKYRFLQTNQQKEFLQQTLNLKGQVFHNAHPSLQDNQTDRVNNKIIWVGRLNKVKNPEFLFPIAQSLPNYDFYFIGAAHDNNILNNITKATKKLPNIYYLGELSMHEVIKHMKTSRLLVSTSDYEGFSNTFIEAWKTGLPIVSLIVDPDNLIKSRKLGYVSNNKDQFIKDIRVMMKNDELWRSYSQNCKEIFEEKFCLTKVMNNIEIFMEEIIKNNH